MGAQEIHILAPRAEPVAVLAFLRTLAPKLEVDGPENRWKRAAIHDRRGIFRRTVSTVAFRHVPDYYEQPDFPQQTGVLAEMFLHRPLTDLPPDVQAALGKVRFCLSVEADPDIDFDDAADARLKYIFAVARHLDAVLLTSAGIRDASGKIIAEAAPEPADPPPDPPTPQRVTRRALALAAVTARALLEQEDPADPDVESTRQRINQWVDTVGLREELEPDEEKLLRRGLGALAPQEAVDGCWRLEGLGVLAWALKKFDVPPHDRTVDPPALLQSLHILDAVGAKGILADPQLRGPDELQAMFEKNLAVHWRLRQFRVEPGKLDWPTNANNEWFPLNLSGIALIDNDLALGESTISRAPQELVDLASSIAQERHLAINWLMGESEVYSETDAST
ncbi:MAG: hypothetical protein QOF78_4232 [Phycisphaerales bacterium]|jgi:hypothetical protein|nr:hypothetical protein [Phycisphaerales bacterium]